MPDRIQGLFQLYSVVKSKCFQIVTLALRFYVLVSLRLFTLFHFIFLQCSHKASINLKITNDFVSTCKVNLYKENASLN